MSPNPEHRYSEAEVRAIFEEAARRQAARQAADAPGLTLAELQAVAADTGLDPDLVAAAAAHLPPDAAEARRYPLWNAPDEVRVERVIPGEVTDELWERMVAELRRAFGQTGRAGQVGRVREWATEGATSTSSITAPVHVEVLPEEGQSRVVLSQSLEAYRQASYGMGGAFTAMAVLIFVLITLRAGPENLLPLLLLTSALLAAGGAGLLGMRYTARQQHRKQTAAFEGVLDRMDLLALRATPPLAARSEATPPPLALPGLEAPPPSAGDPPPRTRTRS